MQSHQFVAVFHVHRDGQGLCFLIMYSRMCTWADSRLLKNLHLPSIVDKISAEKCRDDVCEANAQILFASFVSKNTENCSILSNHVLQQFYYEGDTNIPAVGDITVSLRSPR